VHLDRQKREKEKRRKGSRFGALLGIFDKLIAVSGRFLFVFGALLTLASVALGDGTYQRTKDGKTLVWNDDPKSGDEAKWSGDRDRDGYAHGFGTLTWYTKKTGSAGTTVYARYWGNMVKGKLDGPVNGHSKGKTAHAIFADGSRLSGWVRGTASSRQGAQMRATITRESPVQEPEAPAEGPISAEPEITRNPRPEPAAIESPAEEYAFNSRPSGPSVTISLAPTEADIDDFLRLLVWPPPSLGMRRLSKGSSADLKARLTRGEVIDLADEAARSRGYDPNKYDLPEPQYDPADHAWSLFYEGKPPDRAGENRQYLNIAVGDKTKGTALVPAK
jgi:hypothetical protein